MIGLPAVSDRATEVVRRLTSWFSLCIVAMLLAPALAQMPAELPEPGPGEEEFNILPGSDDSQPWLPKRNSSSRSTAIADNAIARNAAPVVVASLC